MAELKPGIELDELIAHKIMGAQVALYSTDIKAAWVLVEKLKLCVAPYPGRDLWSAFRDSKVFIAPTAPHAICLAALFYSRQQD